MRYAPRPAGNPQRDAGVLSADSDGSAARRGIRLAKNASSAYVDVAASLDAAPHEAEFKLQAAREKAVKYWWLLWNFSVKCGKVSGCCAPRLRLKT